MAKPLFLFVQVLLPLFVSVTAEDGVRGIQYEAPVDGSADTCTETKIGGKIFAAAWLPVARRVRRNESTYIIDITGGAVSSCLTDARFGSLPGGTGATAIAKALFLFVQVLLPLFLPLIAEDGIRGIQYEARIDGSQTLAPRHQSGDQYSPLDGFQSGDDQKK